MKKIMGDVIAIKRIPPNENIIIGEQRSAVVVSDDKSLILAVNTESTIPVIIDKVMITMSGN